MRWFVIIENLCKLWQMIEIKENCDWQIRYDVKCGAYSRCAMKNYGGKYPFYYGNYPYSKWVILTLNLNLWIYNLMKCCIFMRNIHNPNTIWYTANVHFVCQSQSAGMHTFTTDYAILHELCKGWSMNYALLKTERRILIAEFVSNRQT